MNHHTGSPGTPQEAIYRRTDISPEDFFQSLGRVRRTVRDEIERLIEWLDSTIDCDEDSAVDDAPCDGDPDVEPSLGSFDSMSNQAKAWQTRFVTADVDAELDKCDDEHIGEDDESTNDHEPSLGSANAYLAQSQQTWGAGGGNDLEEGNDSGIGDMDGLHEQDCVSRHFSQVE